MTREDKQLLLKDLCGRVIYNTKVRVIGDWFYEEREPYDSTLTFMIMKTFEENDNLSLIVKPYLRPMSSMTMEEQREYISVGRSMSPDNPSVLSDWLNEYHFDYRGLIPMRLALEAPEDMYIQTI